MKGINQYDRKRKNAAVFDVIHIRMFKDVLKYKLVGTNVCCNINSQKVMLRMTFCELISNLFF